MKDGIFGFSRREIIWFAVFFMATIAIIAVSVTRLIGKYYSHNNITYAEIKKHSKDLLNLQEITLFATNVQRSSLNTMIYANDPNELKNIYATIKKYRDSLSSKFVDIAHDNHLDRTLQQDLLQAASQYLIKNNTFISIVSDSGKKEAAATYNVNTMRPALRNLTDLSRKTGQVVTGEIQLAIEKKINIFLQIEFWLLILAFLPYLYFSFRFLYLVIKMIIWDINTKY